MTNETTIRPANRRRRRLRLRLRRVLCTGSVVGTMLLGAACGGGSTMPETRSSTDGRLGELQLQSFRVLPPPGDSYPTGSVAKADLTIRNNGSQRDELVGARSAQAARTELLHFSDPQAQVPIDPGRNEDVLLQLQDLARPAAIGSTIPITLQFRTAGDVTLDVPVSGQRKQ